MYGFASGSSQGAKRRMFPSDGMAVPNPVLKENDPGAKAPGPGDYWPDLTLVQAG
jgi:hypothetical protein